MLVMLGLISSAPAIAESWQTVAANDTESVRLAESSVRRDGVEVFARVLRDYDGTRLNLFEGEWIAHRSMAALYAMDCDLRRLRIVEWTLYAGNLAQGGALWSGRSRGAAYFRSEKNFGDAALIEAVCTTAPASRITAATSANADAY
ncbi:MAG TPA: surface-adhesin E family protein [Steroidobacteraceae bacterium]|nr:surface-adhesin E family protein [Steroidobacteraceae bacterium]